MVVFVTCKNVEDPFKHEVTRGITTFLPYKSIWIFSDTQAQLIPLLEVQSG